MPRESRTAVNSASSRISRRYGERAPHDERQQTRRREGTCDGAAREGGARDAVTLVVGEGGEAWDRVGAAAPWVAAPHPSWRLVGA